MKQFAKKIAKKAFVYSKKLANSNPVTKKAARSAKKLLLKALQNADTREIYNYHTYYPTINEYYVQQQDVKSSDPLISILLPTYNTPEVYLRECIESIIMQSYPKWELCIADDASPDKKVVDIIKEYQKKDKRIKLVQRKTNGHISVASNDALSLATGDFVALMDHDDVLWPNALHEIVKVIRTNKTVDFMYTDEDKIDGSGAIHSYPFLKPDFSPEFLESCNYITHFSCIRTSVMKKIKGFRKGCEGAQDWDLFLRITEVTDRIVHIRKLLYSWRIHEASTASDTDAKPYVYEAQRKLLVDHVDRIGKKAEIETGIIRQHRTVKYEPKGSITVIIQVSSVGSTLRLLESMMHHAAGVKYETIFLSRDILSTDEQQQIKTAFEGSPQFVIGNDLSAVEGHVKTTSIFFIHDEVVLLSDNWARIALADTEIEGVAFVAPVILDASGEFIVSAGVGIGYGPLGYADMLSGMPFDDPHYTRGLYAKSRRNVSAIRGMCFAISASLLFKKLKQLPEDDVIDLCLSFLQDGRRHVYTPYIQVAAYGDHETRGARQFNYDDVYLNPHFKKDNGLMEVSA